MKTVSRICKVFFSMPPTLDLENVTRKFPRVVSTYFEGSLLSNQGKHLLAVCCLVFLTGKITNKYVASKLRLCSEID